MRTVIKGPEVQVGDVYNLESVEFLRDILVDVLHMGCLEMPSSDEVSVRHCAQEKHYQYQSCEAEIFVREAEMAELAYDPAGQPYYMREKSEHYTSRYAEE